ncbi:MAG: YlxM family DNA-binding protein [Clostridiales bacterium]|nr:YlxM family DNA-binding protein [Clostridiales bacterium]
MSAVADMKDKNSAFRMTMLYDFYGELLTERQREFYDLYHNEDFSLAEIAENAGITRQGVRDVIVRAEAILNEMEEKTGIVARFLEVREGLNAIRRSAEQISALNHTQFRSQELEQLARDIQDRAAEMQK